ncbi:MAG: glycosyltransferase family 9 protein, partial [Thermoguttaceae bacterium]
AASHSSISLTPELSLPQLTVLSGRASLFISGDTGPLHIAVATGTRCIGLFGPTLAERTGPYGAHNRIVQIKSPLNGVVVRHASREFMEAIQLEDVTKVCDEVLRETLNR